MLSVNYNGNRKKTKTMNLLPAQKRFEIMHDITKVEFPDLILAQESSIKVYKIFPEEYEHLSYVATQNDEAGILYNMSTLQIVDTVDPNGRLLYLRDEMVRLGKLSDADEIIARMRAVVLQSKGPNNQPFLCISYHGPFRGYSVQKRLDIFKSAIKLLNEYQKEFCFPVIFAGDFNVDIQINLVKSYLKSYFVTCVPNPLRKPEWMLYGNGLLLLHPYLPTGRRERIYDFILTSDSITVRDIKPINIGAIIKSNYPGVYEDDYNAILDHDPLVASVTVERCTSLVHTLPAFIAYIPNGDKDKVAHRERSLEVKNVLWNPYPVVW